MCLSVCLSVCLSASLEVFINESSIVDCIFQTQLVGYRRISTTKRAIRHINTIMEAHQEVSDNFVLVFYLLNAISRNKCTYFMYVSIRKHPV